MSEGSRTANGDKKKRVPYFKYAFHNVYNYTLLAGVASAAALTQNWWLAVLGGGLETLWLVFAPDSKFLRRMWFEKMHEAKLSEESHAEREQRLRELPLNDARRLHALENKREEILKLCAENKAFATELLKDELAKLDQLVDSFLELLISAHRHGQYLATIDFDELEKSMARHERVVQDAEEREQITLAEKNLEVLTQRREKLAEIGRFVATAQGQMDLIENTFRLLADQIVTMRSPRELGGQLDELIGGVEAVRTTAREAEAFFHAVES